MNNQRSVKWKEDSALLSAVGNRHMMPTEPRKPVIGRPTFEGLCRAIIFGFALFVLQVAASAHGPFAPPDSLTTTQKRAVLRLAETRLANYMYLLKGLASLSGSDEDAVDAEDFIESAITDSRPIFNSAQAIIESYTDPEQQPGAPGINRHAKEALNEFRLFFRPAADTALEYEILMREEPRVLDGRVSTRVLYNLQFHGQNERKPGIAYKRIQRVVNMIAVDEGEGNWDVTIAMDGFYVPSPVKPFVEYSVDRDLVAVSQGMLPETSFLAKLRKEEEEATRKADVEEIKKKNAYTSELDEGDRLMLQGEPDLALDYYESAGKIDPLSIDHLIRKKRARRAVAAKAKADFTQALDALAEDLSRQMETKGFRNVAVLEFTEENGQHSELGKYLADQVQIRMARDHTFKMYERFNSAKARANVKGTLMRTGEENEKVSLSATLMDMKRSLMAGSAQHDFPMPEGFSPLPTADSTLVGTTIPVTDPSKVPPPPPAAMPEKDRWAIGATVGVNLTRIAEQDDLTNEFVVNGNGLRAGIEIERISPNGNSRLATGLRHSELRSSTADDDTVRVINVNYLQVPLLYKLYTGHTAIGRFGLQLGGLLDFANGFRTESDDKGEYIRVSWLNVHASPGLCYEVKGPGPSHIVITASYDLMPLGLSGNYLPAGGPQLNALSFAIGVMFWRP